MAQLVLSRGTRYRKPFWNKFKFSFELGPYFLVGSLVLFVGLVTVVTLMFSARQVTKGYVLNSLENDHQELVRESEKMDMKISEVRSLKFLEDSGKVMSMKKPNQIVFVNAATTIAKR